MNLCNDSLGSHRLKWYNYIFASVKITEIIFANNLPMRAMEKVIQLHFNCERCGRKCKSELYNICDTTTWPMKTIWKLVIHRLHHLHNSYHKKKNKLCWSQRKGSAIKKNATQTYEKIVCFWKRNLFPMVLM